MYLVWLPNKETLATVTVGGPGYTKSFSHVRTIKRTKTIQCGWVMGHGQIRINKEDQSFGYINSNNILKLKSLHHNLSTVIPLIHYAPQKKLT